MAILDKVEVRIKSAGEFLTEYDNPDEGGANDGSTATKFIEAKSGAQFSIEISVKRGYHFWGGDCLLVGRHMDGHRGNCSMIDKPGTFRDQVIFEVEHSIEHHMTLNAGQWRQNYFTFAELEMCMTLKLPDGLYQPYHSSDHSGA